MANNSARGQNLTEIVTNWLGIRYFSTFFCNIDNIFRRQLEEICNYAKKYKPAVLQNESHPYLHEKDLRDFCIIGL